VQLYIRQHHDEHDLESVGREFRCVIRPDVD
jgi:hypothetical protein